MAANVEDTALMLQAIAGADKNDPASSNEPSDYRRQLKTSIRGMRVGIPKTYFFDVDPEVEAGVRAGFAVLQKLGASLVDVDIPHAPHAMAVRNILFCSSACYHEKRLEDRPV